MEGDTTKLLFVPSAYDDYGWTPEEFRVLARIHRRAQGKKNGQVGQFFESIPNMAKAIQMSEALVRRSLKVLEAAGAISRENRMGATALIRYESPSNWVPSCELPVIRIRHTPIKNDMGSDKESVTKKAQPLSKTRGERLRKRQGDGYENDRGTPDENDRGVVTKTTDKGIPSEVPPSEVPPLEVNPSRSPDFWISEAKEKNPDRDPLAVETAVLSVLSEKEAVESLSDFNAAIDLYDAASREDHGQRALELSLNNLHRRFGIGAENGK